VLCSSTDEAVFDLPHSIEAPAQARTLIERHLCPVHGQDALAAAQLVVTELATCAVLYGKAPVRLDLGCGVTQLRIAVTHRTEGTPVPEIPLDEDGVLRAALIAKLTRTWGIDPTAEGRELWCCLPTGVLPSRSERGPVSRSGPAR
jgi:hypothetical protein